MSTEPVERHALCQKSGGHNAHGIIGAGGVLHSCPGAPYSIVDVVRMAVEPPIDAQIDEHVLNVYRAWGDADIERQRPVRRDWPYLAGVLDELCEWLSED